MSNEEKLSRVKEWLTENGIAYKESFHRGEYGHSDMVLCDYAVFVKISGEDDDAFYLSHRNGRFAVLIRDSETSEFVIEKIQNTIVKFLLMRQRKYNERLELLERKRQRREAYEREQAERKAHPKKKKRNFRRKKKNSRKHKVEQTKNGIKWKRKRPRISSNTGVRISFMEDTDTLRNAHLEYTTDIQGR